MKRKRLEEKIILLELLLSADKAELDAKNLRIAELEKQVKTLESRLDFVQEANRLSR